MPRRALHSEEAILDAARRIVCDQGPRAATVGAIARVSAAPTGSIYHRFRSVDELLARLWLRAVRRFHAAVLAAAADGVAIERAVRAARANYDFCLTEREDAQLLAAFNAQDLIDRLPPGSDLRGELARVNDPILREVRGTATAIFGTGRRAAADLVLAAVVDVPYALARHHVHGGGSPTRERREAVEVAARAILGQKL